MLEQETVCAVVVTYNRKELLMECLASLLGQVRPLDAIYLIDNASTDGTPKLLKEKGYISGIVEAKDARAEKDCTVENVKIHYVRMDENVGGSGGFYEGVKRAHAKGYDWLWLMDDDAEPMEDTLRVLLGNADQHTFVICPLIVDAVNMVPEYYHHKRLDRYLRETFVTPHEVRTSDILSLDANAFVGPLIRAEIISKIGFPEKDYFIFVDDVEYTYRISRHGKVILCTSAIIYHKNKQIVDNRRFYVTWKEFYAIRNYILFAKKYRISSVFVIMRYLKDLPKIAFKIALLKRSFYECSMITKLLYYSLYEGLRGKPNERYFPIERIYFETYSSIKENRK